MGLLAKDKDKQKSYRLTTPREYFFCKTSPVADWEDYSGQEEVTLQAEKTQEKVSQKDTLLRARETPRGLDGKGHISMK